MKKNENNTGKSDLLPENQHEDKVHFWVTTACLQTNIMFKLFPSTKETEKRKTLNNMALISVQ